MIEILVDKIFAFLWALVGGVVGFLGGYGQHYLERRESRKNVLKIVIDNISCIIADIDRRLENFKSATTIIHDSTKISVDFSCFEAPNWINAQHEKSHFYGYGPKSILDCRNQKWFFNLQTPLDNKLFDDIMMELKILPFDQFRKIREFYRTNLNSCNSTMVQSKSYIALAERIHVSTGEITGVSPFSSLIYIWDLLSARKMASEILSGIEKQI